MQTENLGRREFFKMATAIALPIMMQNLISTLVSSADTVMLGYVSQDAMSASSLAGQIQMVMMMAFYGLNAGCAVLAAQYWGKKDLVTVERIMGLAVRTALLVSSAFALLALLIPGPLMRIFTNEQGIIDEGIRYLRIISVSYIFTGFSQIFISVIRSTEKVLLPTLTYVVSLVINVLLNAVFIFGLLGLPKLGLPGVALGTVCARFAETLICLIYSFTKSDVKVRFKYLFAKTGMLSKDFFKLSLPSMGNDVVWVLAISVYSAIMGRMGSAAVAANAVAVMAVNIGAVACRGFAGGTTIIVSKALGSGNIPQGKLYAKRMLIITALFSVAGTLVIIAISPIIKHIYMGKLTEEALELLGFMFVMRAFQLIGEGVNTCLICGCFRGGGDARWGMFADIFCMWFLVVPLVLAAAYLFKLPPVWVYLVICLDEFYKMPIFFAHYFKYGWLNDITRSKEELS